MKTINKVILVMTIVLGSFSSASAFDMKFDNGNGQLFFNSSHGMVGQSFNMSSDLGAGTTMYHNFDTGFSGSSFDTGFGSSLTIETNPGSLFWIK